jgi:hypothetical protein
MRIPVTIEFADAGKKSGLHTAPDSLAFSFAPASTQRCWREYLPFLSDQAPRCQSIVAR